MAKIDDLITAVSEILKANNNRDEAMRNLIKTNNDMIIMLKGLQTRVEKLEGDK